MIVIVKQIDKNSFLDNFLNDLDKLNKIKTQKEKAEKKNQMCIIQLENHIMISQESVLINIINYLILKEINWNTNMILLNFCLKKYNYNNSFEKEQSIDIEESTVQKVFVDLSDMPPLEGGEKKLKEEKRLNILATTKLLTRLSIILAQTKAATNLCKPKN